MQPWKLLATSKNALLQSVTRASSASRSAGTRVLAARGAAHLELLDRGRGPHRPVAEQAAAEIGAGGDAVVAQVERQREIEQDVIVIAGIERDAVERAGGGDAAQHVERAVAVERRDLDGDDIVDSRQSAARNPRSG